MQKEVLSIFPLPLKNQSENFQRSNQSFCEPNTLITLKAKSGGIFWLTVILGSINLSFFSL